MAHGTFNVPSNQRTRAELRWLPEREALQQAYAEMYNQDPIEVPMYIGADQVSTGDKRAMTPPHEHGKVLGHFSYGDASHVQAAIDAALAARPAWSSLPWEHRAAVFLKPPT